jgi:hypothetical protein
MVIFFIENKIYNIPAKLLIVMHYLLIEGMNFAWKRNSIADISRSTVVLISRLFIKPSMLGLSLTRFCLYSENT